MERIEIKNKDREKVQEFVIESPWSDKVKRIVEVFRPKGFFIRVIRVELYGLDEEECDLSAEGVAKYVAKRIGLNSIEPLVPCAALPTEEPATRYEAYFIAF